MNVKKSVEKERKLRAQRLVRNLKKAYPMPKSELHYRTPFQFLAAVVLSAQCTDRAVNRLTDSLWKKYKTPQDFARARQKILERELAHIPFFRNKARALIGAARIIEHTHAGRVPSTAPELVQLPGVGYKTAHVVLGELYDLWPGIPTDTHVKRFAKRFNLTEENELKKISKDLEALIQKKDWKYVNNGFVLYGRYVCPARPHECRNHPLTKLWPEAAERWPKTK
jgi:endonuclease III